MIQMLFILYFKTPESEHCTIGKSENFIMQNGKSQNFITHNGSKWTFDHAQLGKGENFHNVQKGGKCNT